VKQVVLGLLNENILLSKNLAKQSEETAKRDLIIVELQNKLKLALIRRFARQADSYLDPNAPKQDDLFDELALPEVAEPEALETIEVPAHKKVKARGKRKPLPEELERVQQIYRLPEADLLGPNGEQYIEIGQEMTEQLDIIPADVRVIQHIRIKYAVKGQEELGVKVAPMAPTILPKSIATPGLLAHVAQAKYCHHLPLYRQEAIWKELDVHLPRNSLCRWMMEVGERVSPLVEYLFADMKAKSYLHVDETPVTVLEDAHKKPENASHQGYIWLYANSIGVLYDYRSSREGAHPLEMLEDFKGYIQKDGYGGYDALFTNADRIGVGCMAHVRRKFTDIQKVAGKKSRSSVADHVVNLIAKLYHLESVAKKENRTEDEIYQMRQEKATLILAKLHDYLKEQSQKAPPQSILGKACLLYTSPSPRDH
jgi:transposase